MRIRGMYWIAQLVGWGAYCLLVLIAIYTKKPEDLDINALVSVFSLITVGVVITHLQRLLFIRLKWLDLRLTPLIPRLLSLSFVGAILISSITTLIVFVLSNGQPDEELTFAGFLVNVFSVWILLMFWNTIYFTYHFFQKSRKQEISNLELVASNKESELKNLRSQLNPHFLFNSLNSIRALVDIEPVKAKKSITTLSNLLRQSLLLGKENTVVLEKELEISRSYLELEKIRFEERLLVEWEVDDSLMRIEIPPFILQMMVENAVKHGVSQLKEGGVVKVMIFRSNESIVLRVENSGVLGSAVDLGVGIQNIKQRLKLQYGNLATFKLEQEEKKVVAEITFN